MAANFYQAIWAFAVCFCVTVVVTFFTEPRKEAELVGLVYSLTPRPKTSDFPGMNGRRFGRLEFWRFARF